MSPEVEFSKDVKAILINMIKELKESIFILLKGKYDENNSTRKRELFQKGQKIYILELKSTVIKRKNSLQVLCSRFVMKKKETMKSKIDK